MSPGNNQQFNLHYSKIPLRKRDSEVFEWRMDADNPALEKPAFCKIY